MNSLSRVDPELIPLLSAVPHLGSSTESLSSKRALLTDMLASSPPANERTVSSEIVFIDGPSGTSALRLVVYRPIAVTSPVAAIYHIHGGGYIIGTPEIADSVNRALVDELQCVIVSVDYRLAPEARHPAQIEDCYAGLKWLFDNAAALGVDRERIGVKGESAGGGLAAALALLARDRGEYGLAFQHLNAPMLDDRTCCLRDPHPWTGEFMWTLEDNLFGWSALLGGPPGALDVSPYAAPGRAQDLRGLPSTFIDVGSLDLFLEEDLDYARRLTRAGVSVEFHVHPGAFHGFQMAATARVSVRAHRISVEALRRAISPAD